MEMVTQWLGRIGVAVSSKLQRIAGRTSLLQSKALVAHKLASDKTVSNVFEPLTPVVMTDRESDRYVSELRHALTNDQVRNIAITGDYGAGKSSLIRTFVEKHKELNYAWVSLATFGKDGVIDSPASPLQDEQSAKPNVSSGQPDTTTDFKLVDRIEETIVQQLLYTVRAKDLPKTRLKRIVQASSSSITVSTVFLILGRRCKNSQPSPTLGTLSTFNQPSFP